MHLTSVALWPSDMRLSPLHSVGSGTRCGSLGIPKVEGFRCLNRNGWKMKGKKGV